MSRKHSAADRPKNRNAYCSFCRKSYRDVGPLVEGPGDVYICGECIELCQSIIEEETRRRDPSKNRLLEVDEIVQKLDRVAGGLREDKQRLAGAVRAHYERLAEERPDDKNAAVQRSAILLLGPSVGSKVLLARGLAYLFGVPFAHGDALALAPTSSPDAIRESLLFRLAEAAHYHIETAERGLVYVDGIDRPESVPLLIEVLQSRDKKTLFEGFALDPSRILFVCGGSFPGLEEAMARRGRHPQQSPTADDLLAFGVRPELVRRLNPIMTLPALDEAMLLPALAHVDLKSLIVS
jgi:ATP-dependent Clp protease ATP-binding subunit ClpX